MIILGLTGSIGMGKSTTAEIFKTLGIPVHDADKAVHDLMAAGGDAVSAILEEFPEAESINDKGQRFINRPKLGKSVFNNKERLKKLEDILHPMVRARTDVFVDYHRKAETPLVVLDIPLLYETGGEKRCDYVMVVTADAETQKKRVMARQLMTEEKFNAILSAQLPDEEKRKKADFIVFTDKSIEDTTTQIRAVLKKLL